MRPKQFQDTLLLKVDTLNASEGRIALKTYQLLPSLDTANDDRRVVIVDRIQVQALPRTLLTISATGAQPFHSDTYLQLQWNVFPYGIYRPDASPTWPKAIPVCSEAYRLISAVNPTNFTLDLKKISKDVPMALRPQYMRFDQPEPDFKLNFKAFDNASETVQLRIKTFVRIFPQLDPPIQVNQPTLAIQRSPESTTTEDSDTPRELVPA